MNWYKEAINLLESDICNDDWRNICVEIAKTNPSVLVNASRSITSRLKINLAKKGCLELMQSERKIEAIKLCREITGMGLRESKEFVESL